MVFHKCSECSFATNRSDNLKRHSKNVHGGRVNNKVVPTKSSVVTSQLGVRLAKRSREYRNQNMACILKKNMRKLWIL